MLNRLLELLKDGQTKSLQEISEIFEIDRDLLKSELEYLEKSGYIRQVKLDNSCSHNCSNCKESKAVIPHITMWELVKNGR